MILISGFIHRTAFGSSKSSAEYFFRRIHFPLCRMGCVLYLQSRT
jgi:hypothetical protein